MVANRAVVRRYGEQNPAYEPAHPHPNRGPPRGPLRVMGTRAAAVPGQWPAGNARILDELGECRAEPPTSIAEQCRCDEAANDFMMAVTSSTAMTRPRPDPPDPESSEAEFASTYPDTDPPPTLPPNHPAAPG